MQGGSIYSLAVSAGTAAPIAPARRPAAVAAAAAEAAEARRRPRRPPRTPHRPRPVRAASPFTVRMEIDIAAERRQVFEEAWRVMKNRFYDPKMHGANWAAAKDTYEPLLAYIADDRGAAQRDHGDDRRHERLAHRHLRRRPASGRKPSAEERIQTRYPGFDLEPDASGYYKVSYIYRKGPADHDYVKLAAGNFVLAVNGKQLKTSDNYWKLFNILPGRKFEFLVNSKPSTDGAWTVTLEPLTAAAAEQPGVRPLGGRPQGHGGQDFRRPDRLPAHQGHGCALAREVPVGPAGEPGQERR